MLRNLTFLVYILTAIVTLVPLDFVFLGIYVNLLYDGKSLNIDSLIYENFALLIFTVKEY